VAESLKFYGFGVLWFGFLSFIPVLETTEKEDFFQKKELKAFVFRRLGSGRIRRF